MKRLLTTNCFGLVESFKKIKIDQIIVILAESIDKNLIMPLTIVFN